jgi:hypothetical protein
MLNFVKNAIITVIPNNDQVQRHLTFAPVYLKHLSIIRKFRRSCTLKIGGIFHTDYKSQIALHYTRMRLYAVD